MPTLTDEIARRRTFAIISHPDAGKTTLTEKLLLFGGAIQLAGEVKARGERRRTRSDWMTIERERGISVSSAVMSFEHEGLAFNLLDTPGHQDFSEDTYRTLTAVDSAVMVLDAAKGIEEQTRKLFEVCRLRDVPIITFVNKLDREARDPFDLLDEIEQSLALDVTPASWPIGMGRDFLGTYDLFADALLLFERGVHDRVVEPVRCSGLDDPELARRLPEEAHREAARGGRDGARPLPAVRRARPISAGHLTPVYFGSALNNFGVRELLHGVAELAPAAAPAAGPRDQWAAADLTGRARGHRLRLQGAGQYRPAAPRPHRLRAALLRPVSARHEAEERPQRTPDVGAEPGVFPRPRAQPRRGGLARRHHRHPEPRQPRIGDTLTEGEAIRVTGIPNFAPEILQRVKVDDPMKSKHLKHALEQFAEEGVTRVFKPADRRRLDHRRRRRIAARRAEGAARRRI